MANITNPITGQPFAPPDPTSVVAPMGMVGGLPEGLNPIALEETFKKFAPEAANSIYEGAQTVTKPAMDAFKNNQVSKYISNFFSNPTQQQAIQRAIKGIK